MLPLSVHHCRHGRGVPAGCGQWCTQGEVGGGVHPAMYTRPVTPGQLHQARYHTRPGTTLGRVPHQGQEPHQGSGATPGGPQLVQNWVQNWSRTGYNLALFPELVNVALRAACLAELATSCKAGCRKCQNGCTQGCRTGVRRGPTSVGGRSAELLVAHTSCRLSVPGSTSGCKSGVPKGVWYPGVCGTQGCLHTINNKVELCPLVQA